MKWFIVILVLAIILIAGCVQQETGITSQTKAIPNNTVMLNEENTNLYDGYCTTDNSGTCETKPIEWMASNNLTKTKAFNSSFNYSIFLYKPYTTVYYKYYYSYDLMDGDRLAIKGYENSDKETLTVNDVLCTHHVAVVVTCPIPENTKFRLVNVTKNLVNTTVRINPMEPPAGTHDIPLNPYVGIHIVSQDGSTLFSSNCDFTSSDNCFLPLDSSVASEIATSKIVLSMKNSDGSPIENATESIKISGRAFFPRCRLVIINNSEECIPV